MLTDAALKALKPQDKIYKVTDRDGMYVRVAPSGALSFRLDYRLNGRRETVYLGKYGRDGISLARAWPGMPPQPRPLSRKVTEADIRLLPTLLRFDPVYFGHFKCRLRALVDYPALWAYTRRLFQHPDIRSTVDFQHIKGHYYGSHTFLNPSGIVPVGPQRDYDARY